MQGRHEAPGEARRELDAIEAKVNALEAAATDEWQRGVAKTLKILVRGQSHALDEFGHHRKAMDLLLLETFKAKNAAEGRRPPGGAGS